MKPSPYPSYYVLSAKCLTWVARVKAHTRSIRGRIREHTYVLRAWLPPLLQLVHARYPARTAMAIGGNSLYRNKFFNSPTRASVFATHSERQTSDAYCRESTEREITSQTSLASRIECYVDNSLYGNNFSDNII